MAKITEPWKFEEFDAERSNSSGDIVSLLRNNEDYQWPGILGENAPPTMSSTLARESLQNSWDAATERRDASEKSRIDFHAEFQFLELTGEKKLSFVKAAGLDQLAKHEQKMATKTPFISNPVTFSKINNKSHPLKVMLLKESGTTGMYGGWGTDASKMHLALNNIGYTEKSIDSGGSFGYGKSALARSSGIRSVICYSAFNPDIASIHPDGEHEEEPGVTRRIFGCCYWPKHKIETRGKTISNNGWARFGLEKSTGRPKTNKEADSLADLLGIPIRDGSKASDIGSTFLIIDPIVSPKDLCRAIERWWWPALIDKGSKFNVSIIDYEQNVLKPQPTEDPALSEFIKASRIKSDTVEKTESAVFFQAVNGVDPGGLYMVADPSEDGWTNPLSNSFFVNDDPDQTLKHRSIIALIRRPRMVVRYFDVGESKPFIRGIFIASPNGQANAMLGKTEPALHTDWETVPAEDRKHDHESFELARKVKERIRSNANSFRNTFRLASVTSGKIHLQEFDRIMKSFIGTGKGKKKATDKNRKARPFDITFPNGQPEATELNEGSNDGLIHIPTIFKISLDDDQNRANGKTQIQIRFQFETDGKSSNDTDFLGRIKYLKSKGDKFSFQEQLDGTYLGIGTLTKSGVTITVDSEAYEDIFTGSWKPVVTSLWDKQATDEGTGDSTNE